MKKIENVLRAQESHWVGDGFPVRSIFSYRKNAERMSPFLLFDYGGPWNFEPVKGEPRGVGEHPHKGFETVTIVYDGEVSHRDSTGGGGTIGPGEVQWMTAGAGVVHEEFHSTGFSRAGGPFRMVQLWVDLPAEDKSSPAKYQALTRTMIPEVDVSGAKVRVIAGEFGGASGPATTFSPINLWDIRIKSGAAMQLLLPDNHTSMIAVLSGHLTIDGTSVGEAEIAELTRSGQNITLHADGETMVLVMTGQPLGQPVVGYGPFVMTSEQEIRDAIEEFNSGGFGSLASA